MNHIVYDIWGITGVVLAVHCWYLASRHRTDGKGWGVSFLPTWRLKSKYDRQGYRYLWAGNFLIAAAVLPDILYRMLAG
jgi:hypothetical protein